jgi:2',3'-cyclic-nucleotide 2'-phosphodiesterase (5'-nucleotidase family)
MRKNLILISALLALSCSSVKAQNYQMEKISRTRILIDSTYDASPNQSGQLFIAHYKQKVDSISNPFVGRSAKYMAAKRPESAISNLLADILVDAGNQYKEKPDLGIYNMGGIRAALPKGNINFGNILDIAPFENKICFVTMRGSDLMELFRNIAKVYGEGVSRGVKIIVSKDGKLVSAQINGKDIKANKKYRISTIDYLAQGNDNMPAFKKSIEKVMPQDASNDTRFIIANYFKKMESKGEIVDSNIEGRITVNE